MGSTSLIMQWHRSNAFRPTDMQAWLSLLDASASRKSTAEWAQWFLPPHLLLAAVVMVHDTPDRCCFCSHQLMGCANDILFKILKTGRLAPHSTAAVLFACLHRPGAALAA